MPTHDIVPTHLVIKAMRDNGYKNAAYAIAELIDNSIQAGASQVELLCGEEVVALRERARSRISKIAVLDNGSGMNAEVLRMALQFGNGTHLTPETQDGIGRFGMGLPNSSISQCRRVDVWSWQEGVASAIHTYIDLGEVENGSLVEVPEPAPKPVPEDWLKVGKCFSTKGTLVVWSAIDRCMWRTGQTIIKNSEFLIGRMHRRALFDGKVRIRFVSFDINSPSSDVSESFARPNDPSYLMSETSCDAPFDVNPMFQVWGDYTFTIRFNSKEHEVRVRVSIAKEEARRGYNPGSFPHGQHAKKNVGVSIVRADRELDLDPTWSNPSEPRDRWWGVEVDFPPALDDLFGVTNNKQAARNFTDLAKVDVESLLKEEQSFGALKAELEADADPRLPLLEIAAHIQKNIAAIRNLLKAQTERKPKAKRHDEPNPEEKATVITRKRIEEGFQGESDRQEGRPPEERQAEIFEELVNEGVTEKVAEELAAETVRRGLKFTFADAPLESSAFFDIKARGGAMIVSLNTQHSAYSHLVEILEEDVEDVDEEILKSRLVRARDGLKLLLMAWARYEDEEPLGKRRDRAREARWDWGKIARDFLVEDD